MFFEKVIEREKEKTMKKTISKIQQKKAEIEVLERLFRELGYMEENNAQRYTVVGKETEQAKDHNGNLKWVDDEHTIPYYRDKYAYIPITVEDMTDEEYAMHEALASIKSALEKLL